MTVFIPDFEKMERDRQHRLFEEWWFKLPFDYRVTFQTNEVHWAGWYGRQTQVNALQDEFYLQQGILKAEIGRLEDELYRLKQPDFTLGAATEIPEGWATEPDVTEEFRQQWRDAVAKQEQR